jgi:hypothetical protein
MKTRKYVFGFLLAATVQACLLAWIPGAISVPQPPVVVKGAGRKSVVKAKVSDASSVERIGSAKHARTGGVTVADGALKTPPDPKSLPPLSIKWPESTAELAELSRQFGLMFQSVGPADRVLGELVPSPAGWALRPWSGAKAPISNRVRSLSPQPGQGEARSVRVLVPAEVDRGFAAQQLRELERLGLKQEEADGQGAVFQKGATGLWVLHIEVTYPRAKTRRTDS